MLVAFKLNFNAGFKDHKCATSLKSTHSAKTGMRLPREDILKKLSIWVIKKKKNHWKSDAFITQKRTEVSLLIKLIFINPGLGDPLIKTEKDCVHIWETLSPFYFIFHQVWAWRFSKLNSPNPGN